MALSATLYNELRDLAAQVLRGRGPAMVEPTVLLHDAWLKMAESRQADYRSRTHFLASAARVMKHVLVDRARQQAAQKRGGEFSRITLSTRAISDTKDSLEILALEEALQELATFDQRAAQVVELRVFAGLQHQEIAEHLDVSERTVRGDWNMAQAWLRRALNLQGS